MTRISGTQARQIGKGRAGHKKGDDKYVLSRSPDYILMGNVAVLPYPVDKEGMAKKLVRNQSTSCGLSRDFMTPMNSFVSS